MNSNFSVKPLVIIVAAAAVMVACGKTEEKPAVHGGAIAAKVNGSEISVEQIETVMARVGNIPPAQTRQAGKQILEKLIDTEVMAQQAVDKKIDKDPKIAVALDLARREILANAYVQQATGATAKPSDQEIKAYFDNNPALFKERRIYSLRELSIAAGPDFAPEVQQQLGKVKSLEEVAVWLKGKGIGFTPSLVNKPSEQLPVEVVPKLLAMKDGEIILIPTGNGLLLEQRVRAQPAPADEAAARPFIERLLLKQKSNEATLNELKAVRGKARIEYLGDYVQTPAAAPSTPGDAK